MLLFRLLFVTVICELDLRRMARAPAALPPPRACRCRAAAALIFRRHGAAACTYAALRKCSLKPPPSAPFQYTAVLPPFCGCRGMSRCRDAPDASRPAATPPTLCCRPRPLSPAPPPRHRRQMIFALYFCRAQNISYLRCSISASFILLFDIAVFHYIVASSCCFSSIWIDSSFRHLLPPHAIYAIFFSRLRAAAALRFFSRVAAT